MPKRWVVNPKRDKRGLTKKQAIFADNVPLVGKDEAAIMAYPDLSPESQRVTACRNMNNPTILQAISDIADAKGLTKNACVEAIKDGLTATRLYGKKGIEHADSPARLRAAELGLKLHGELKNDASVPEVQMTKDVFIKLCETFWETKPAELP